MEGDGNVSWEKKTLDQLGNVSRGKSKHRPRNDPKLFGGKYPFIQTADVKNANFYITEYSDTYNEVGLAQSKLWDMGTLCITIAANIADTAILGIPACFPDSIMGFIPYDRISDVRFVKYCFDMLQQDCKQISQGTAQDNLSWQKLSTIEFPAPPIEKQRRIADILSAYDDLIENNQKQIKLLEEAAQRLYKEWFVDLRFPGYENTKIVDGVPEGWKTLHISDVCDTIGGGTPSTKVKEYYQDGNIPWVTPTDITKNNSLVLLGTATKITNEGLNNSSAKMVPPGTILMTSRASVGFFGICDFPVCTNQGFISCIPYQQNMQMYLLYNLLSRVDEIRGKAGGSTYLEISKKIFRDFEIIVPDTQLLNMFQTTTEKSIELLRILSKQIIELQEARDRLLPKLMSGELEV